MGVMTRPGWSLIRGTSRRFLDPKDWTPVLDVKWIRDNQEAFLKGLTDRGFPIRKAR